MPLRGAGSFEGLFSSYPSPNTLSDFTVSVNHTLTGDEWYRNLTINSNRLVITGSYCLHVLGTLTIGDSAFIAPGIAIDGGEGAGGSIGTAGAHIAAGISGGALTPAGAGNGSNSSAVPGLALHAGGGGGGGAGGEGGNNGGFGGMGGYSGGGGGGPGPNDGLPGALNSLANQAGTVLPLGNVLGLDALLTGHVCILGTHYPIYGGGGGGGGGQDGAFGGGGGGGGGGVLRVIANRIVRSGSGTAPQFYAGGGRGGDADGASNADAGPGGGGGGGVILVGYGSIDPTIVFNVIGGSGGDSIDPLNSPKVGGQGASGRVYQFVL